MKNLSEFKNSRYYKKGEKLTAKEKASIVILEKMAKLDEEYKNYEKKYNIARYNDLEKKRNKSVELKSDVETMKNLKQEYICLGKSLFYLS